jgi:Ser/Thr protein kinase RdoA (MazF antagonist)
MHEFQKPALNPGHPGTPFFATGAANRPQRPHNGHTMNESCSQPAICAAPSLATAVALEQVVGECLVANYGIRGQLQRLPGENLNFLVTHDENQKHVFKIVDEHMPPAAVEMESAAIEHALKGGFRPRLPRILKNKHNTIETGIELPLKGLHRSRLIEFIDGVELSSVADISERMVRNVGETVAEFNQVMQDFDHPATRRNHRWNLADAGQHQDKIQLIAEPEKRDLLAWAYAAWREAQPRLADLPWQFIHGDAHDENILMAGERVSGLIDFGDCCHNPAVCDLATCVTYMMMRGDPMRIAQAIVRGYRQVRALSAAEVECLYPLVCGRLAVSLCIVNERKTIDPHNPNWFGGEGRTWQLLGRLQALGQAWFETGIRDSR